MGRCVGGRISRRTSRCENFYFLERDTRLYALRSTVDSLAPCPLSLTTRRRMLFFFSMLDLRA